jgi:hypothetical protein
MVEAVVYAVDISAPTSPLSIANTTLGEPSNTSLKIRGVEAVAEVMIFDLDHVPTSLNTGTQLLMLAYEGKGGIVLDPTEHVRYTGGVHKLTPYGPGSGV